MNMVEGTYLEEKLERLRKIYETRNYLLDEIKHSDLMSGKYERTCDYLNYVENLLVLSSITTVYVSISAFASSGSVPNGITDFSIKICAITAGIK